MVKKYIQVIIGETMSENKMLAVILKLMLLLTAKERMEIMLNFCLHCGSDQPRCQCWNDE